jgi:hydrogenase maturation protease
MMNLLVIGYGNSLRGDDAVGRRLAEAVEGWQAPNIAIRSLHQLVPELVEDLQGSAFVLFVDAVAEGGEVQLRKIVANPGNQPLNHYCDPGNLLAMAHDLYGRCPAGWLLTIPGCHFEMSEEISPMAQENMIRALALVKELYQGTMQYA